jgi:hypothetical protein
MKKKAKRSGFQSNVDLDRCEACDRAYDITLGGWVILASGQLICDPVDSHECWEKVATLTEKKQGLTNANT